jgi:hypothetical protein
MDDETTAVIQGIVDQGGAAATAVTRLLIEFAEHKARAKILESVIVERDRLRAVVDTARDLFLKDNEHWSEHHAPLVVALAALDVSAHMGGKDEDVETSVGPPAGLDGPDDHGRRDVPGRGVAGLAGQPEIGANMGGEPEDDVPQEPYRHGLNMLGEPCANDDQGGS